MLHSRVAHARIAHARLTAAVRPSALNLIFNTSRLHLTQQIKFNYEQYHTLAKIVASHQTTIQTSLTPFIRPSTLPLTFRTHHLSQSPSAPFSTGSSSKVRRRRWWDPILFLIAPNGELTPSAAFTIALVACSVAFGAALYYTQFVHPNVHELKDQALILIEAKLPKEVLHALYDQTTSTPAPLLLTPNATTATVPTPTTAASSTRSTVLQAPALKVGATFQSDRPESDTFELYIPIPDTNFGQGQLHIKGKKKPPVDHSLPAHAIITTDRPTLVESTTTTTTPASTTPSTSAVSTTTPARPSSLPSSLQLEWDLNYVALIFPEKQISYLYDFGTKQFQTLTKEQSLAPKPVPGTLSHALSLKWSWYPGILIALSCITLVPLRFYLKGRSTQRLNETLSASLRANTDLRQRLGLVTQYAPIQTSLQTTTFGNKTVMKWNQTKTVPDYHKVYQTHLVSGGLSNQQKTGRVTILSFFEQPVKTTHQTPLPPHWRVVEAKLVIDGTDRSIPLRGVQIDNKVMQLSGLEKFLQNLPLIGRFFKF